MEFDSTSFNYSSSMLGTFEEPDVCCKHETKTKRYRSACFWSHRQAASFDFVERYPLQIYLTVSFIEFIVNAAVTFSCSNDTFTFCQPQYTFRTTGENIKSRKLYMDIKEGLKMLSYLATDLSFNLNKHVHVKDRYPYIIDTLSNNVIYKLGFSGFCRKGIDQIAPSCLPGNGLDIATNIFKDLGFQLGYLSKVENAYAMGADLSQAYSWALHYLNDIFYQVKNEEDVAENLDMEALLAIHQAKNMEVFALALRVSSFISVFLSLMGVNIGWLIFAAKGKVRENYTKFAVALLLTLSGVSFVSKTMILIFETSFFLLLHDQCKNLAIAHVALGSGYLLLIVDLVLVAVQSYISFLLKY